MESTRRCEPRSDSASGDVPEVLRVALAGRTKSDDREVSRVDRKPEVGNGPTSQVGEEPVCNLHMRAASLADQVAVRRAREVVGGWAVSEMSMYDHAQAFEFLEVAIDRRDRDIRGLSLNLRRQLLGGPMALSLE